MKNVYLSIPDFKELTKKYLCVDMHYHTLYSDGAARIKDILRKIKKLNIGVAITDHNTIKGAVRIKSLPNSEHIIPGIEIKTKEKIDILCYFENIDKLEKFYAKEIKERRRGIWSLSYINIGYRKLIEITNKYDCLVAFAHPVKYKNWGNIIDFVPAAEVINSGYKGSEKLISAVQEKKISFTAGSDGHSIYELGTCLTCSKAKNISEFLENIRNRKNIVVGKGLRLGRKQRFYYNILNRVKNLKP